jgi:hypothetical protein
MKVEKRQADFKVINHKQAEDCADYKKKDKKL